MLSSPFPRRRLLKYFAAASAALTLGELAYRSHREPTYAQGIVHEERLTISGDDFLSGSFDQTDLEGGQIRLSDGAASGQYISSPRKTRFPFNAVGSRWQALTPTGSTLEIALRTSRDGSTWSEWREPGPLVDGKDDPGPGVGSLLIESGSWLQVRLRLTAPDSAVSPLIQGITLIYLDSSTGPTLADWQAEMERSGQTIDPNAIIQPYIISRSAWGCPQPNGSPGWPPEYQTVQKVFVHHTVTENSTESFAAVRAIWHYHAQTLGWGDIGYNFLIDSVGNKFEGRYGGDGVVAGHALCYNPGSIGVAALGTYGNSSRPASAYPSDLMRQAFVTLISAKCYRWNIDPAGSGWFVDQNLMNICGHRDGNGHCGNGTSCPGDHLYALLPNIRSEAAARIRGAQATATPTFTPTHTPTPTRTPTPTPTPTPRPPLMILSRRSAYFLADPSTLPTPQAFMVLNGGDIGFSWKVTPAPPDWLRVSPTSGSAGQAFTLTADRSKLGPGDRRTTTLTITPSYSSAAAQTITVGFYYSPVPLPRSYFPVVH